MLNEIEKFVEENSSSVMTDIDERNGKEGLILTVAWVNSGYRDDEIDREHRLDALFEITSEIEDKFDVSIEDVDEWDDERESVLVVLN